MWFGAHFRIFTKGPIPGHVCAVFPHIKTKVSPSLGELMKTVYLNERGELDTGGAAKYDIQNFTRPATPDEYASLFAKMRKDPGLVRYLKGEFEGEAWKTLSLEERLDYVLWSD